MKAAERKAKESLLLAELAKCMSVTAACDLAGVPRRTFYNWQKTSKRFADAVTDAIGQGNDLLDDTIIERAIKGVAEPLVSMGKLVYEEKPLFDKVTGKPELDKRGRPIMERGAQILISKPSDRMLELAAKSRMKKYRDRSDLDLLEQINQNTGGQVVINTKDLTNEELAHLKALALAIKARKEAAEKTEKAK